jgi:hypothetical protein
MSENKTVSTSVVEIQKYDPNIEYVFDFESAEFIAMERIIDNSGSAIVKYRAPKPPKGSLSGAVSFKSNNCPIPNLTGISVQPGAEVLVINKTLFIPAQIPL